MYPPLFRPLPNFGHIPVNPGRPLGQILAERRMQEEDEIERQELARGIIKPRKPPEADQLRYMYHEVRPYQSKITLQEVSVILTVIDEEPIESFSSGVADLKRAILREWRNWKDPTHPLAYPDDSRMRKLEQQQMAQQSPSGSEASAIKAGSKSKRKSSRLNDGSDDGFEADLRPLSQGSPLLPVTPAANEDFDLRRSKGVEQARGLTRNKINAESDRRTRVADNIVRRAEAARHGEGGGATQSKVAKSPKASEASAFMKKASKAKPHQMATGATRGRGRPRKVPLPDEKTPGKTAGSRGGAAARSRDQ